MKHSGVSSFSVILTFVSLSLLAFIFIPLLSIQLTPARTLSKTLTVSFNWQDASAKAVEQEVTSKLEGLFSMVKGLSNIESESRKGSGSVSLSFSNTVNMEMIRFELAMLIRQVRQNLPQGVTYPQLSRGATGRIESPLLTYTFNGSASPFYLQKYAEENFVSRLSLKGVSNVNVSEASPYHWEILFNTERLQALGMRASDIKTAVTNYFNHQFIGKGYYASRDGDYLQETNLNLSGHVSDSLNWERIPVKKIGERVIYLGDVATARYKETMPQSYSRINGLNSIIITVYGEEGTNTLDLAQRVRQEVDALRADLPAGYAFLLSNDSTIYLSEDLQRIGWRTLLSLVLLLLFVWISSRQVRYLFVIVLGLVMNLLIACIFYYLFDVEIHLFSLAGITISFGIIINNSIVMIDHLRISKNKSVFLALLGATLTTMAALSVIFFLNAQQRANLTDLAMIILINLAISLLIAYYLIPALMDNVDLYNRKRKLTGKRVQRILRIKNLYAGFILFGKRYTWIYMTALILGFGIPFFLLPDRIGKENEEVGYWASLYNQWAGSEWFRDVRPVIEKSFGGSLRLFVQDVFSSSYYGEPERIKLRVNARMPEGSSVQQMNETIMQMENMITSHKEVEFFRTTVTGSSPPSADILILFKPEFEYGAEPFMLKSALEDKAIDLGGADWGVSGSPQNYFGNGFNNSIGSPYVSGRIILEGYNYDELYSYAEKMKSMLAENARIQDLLIVGAPNTYGNFRPFQEFFLEFDEEKMAQQNIAMSEMYSRLGDWNTNERVASVFFNNKMQQVWMVSDRRADFNVWDFTHTGFGTDSVSHKMSELGTISKRRTGNSIFKFNQQYRLAIAYNFVGSYQLEKTLKERAMDQMNEILPLGYRASESGYSWRSPPGNPYHLLALIIVIIFFICSVLFESLKQPFAILMLIPFPFIGTFLTFYLFKINFDQGGYAAFVLLIGLSVNAGIFIVNEYNHLRKMHPHLDHLTLYLKAFRHKITAITLTILSTTVGLVPFLLGGQHEVFWYAFAAGTIGGLVFSLIGVVFFLPLFMVKKSL